MRVRWLVVVVAVMGLLAASCGRSDDDQETGASETTAPAEETGGGSGDFGDMTEVCSDGDASGATAQGVTDDEIAVATCLQKMGEYVQGGPSFYSLAEASQDHYTGMMIDRAAKSGGPVHAVRQSWG